MTLPKIKKFTDYNHYPDEAQPTTDADMQDYMLNQNDILGALTKRLWQPQTAYKLGDIVASDTMADGLVAVCTIAGVTSDIEPEWGVNETTVIDNSCTWIMRPAYCYGLATEGDVQTVYDGGEAEVSRLLSLGVLDKIFEIFKGRIGELFGDNDVLPIANGGTGATTAEQARKNLDANGFVTGLSVSGRTITYTKKDGTSGTITTQDTVYSNPAKTYVSAVYRSGTQWYIVFASGMIMQGGYQSRSGDVITITFPKAFSNTNYQVFKSTQRSEGQWATQIYEQFWNKTTTNVKTYDERGDIMWVAFGY